MKTRYRVNWRGKLILQVLHQNWLYTTEEYRNNYGTWKDARVEDLTQGDVL